MICACDNDRSMKMALNDEKMEGSHGACGFDVYVWM